MYKRSLHIYPHITCFAGRCSAFMCSKTLLQPRSMPDACRRFADTSDRATWLNRNPSVDERCGRNALPFTAMDQQTRGTHDTPRDVSRNMQKDMTHKPISAPRGRPMLRDAMSPSESSLCNHRFVVDCGKPSVVAIFLATKPRVAVRSMAKRSSVDRTML